MRLLYSLSIRIFSLLVLLSSPFNAKARQWIKGRRGVFDRLRKNIEKNDRIIWFHCASLGEFEQGRPLMEAVKRDYPDHRILLTFFSPSGYEVRKDYSVADIVCYLPADTQFNAARFVKTVHPRLVFFIKYEFWFNYIDQLARRNVPVFVVSAIFRRSQYFFRPWGKWSQKQLRKITFFFVQNEKSMALLRMVRVTHAAVSGDTRFDRVLKIKSEAADFPLIDSFADKGSTLVAGSTWPPDEDILRSLLENYKGKLKLVIAPHVTSPENIERIRQKFIEFNPVIYSKQENHNMSRSSVMIIDIMGKLAYIYRYGKIAYVGGGFGNGIHNTLEAATYGIPVLFGPKYSRFQEAVIMQERGCGFPVHDERECLHVVEELLGDVKKYAHASAVADRYVQESAGAVKKVLEKASPFLKA